MENDNKFAQYNAVKIHTDPISFSASYLAKNENGIFLEGGNYLYQLTAYHVKQSEINSSREHKFLNSDDLLALFEEILQLVKEKWDHYTYLPLKARYISLQENEDYYRLRWKWNKNKMELSIPKKECLSLPITQITLENICRLITIDFLTTLKLLHPILASSIKQVEGTLHGTHGTISTMIKEEPTIITAT